MRTTMLLLLTATVLRGQTPAPQPRFALEITEDTPPPVYAIVQDDGALSESTFFGANLHPLPNRAVDARAPSALKLTFTAAGDEVELTATLVFDAIGKADTSLTLQNNPHLELGATPCISTNRLSSAIWNSSAFNRGPSKSSTRNYPLHALFPAKTWSHPFAPKFSAWTAKDTASPFTTSHRKPS